VVKDHAWFFGAYERNPQFTPPAQVAISELNPPPLSGQSYSANRVFEAWQGKLNGQITPSHALTFSAQADPFTGIIRNYWAEFGLPSAELQALTLQSQSTTARGRASGRRATPASSARTCRSRRRYAQQRGGLTVTNFQGDGSPIFNLAEGLFYNGNPSRIGAASARPGEPGADDVQRALRPQPHVQGRRGLPEDRVAVLVHVSRQPELLHLRFRRGHAHDAPPARRPVVPGHAARGVGLRTGRSGASTASTGST
jgi:hypothetical protein